MEPAPPTSWQWLWRYVAAALIIAFLGVRYFAYDRPLAPIDVVLLAFHESSHWAMIWTPRTVYFLAGSVGQIAIPLAVGLYLYLVQRDRLGGAVGLAWAGLSCASVARYVADAPDESLPLVGGDTHDWAYLLGPEAFGRMDLAAPLADAVRLAGATAVVAAVLGCVAIPVLTAYGILPASPAARVPPPSPGCVAEAASAADRILASPPPRRPAPTGGGQGEQGGISG